MDGVTEAKEQTGSPGTFRCQSGSMASRMSSRSSVPSASITQTSYDAPLPRKR
jgi:hypothetical protein